MKVYNPIGSKERFLEMFQNVNKIKLNESIYESDEQNESSEAILNSAYNQLKSKSIKIVQTNTQSDGNESFVELICSDNQNNEIVFRFKVLSSQDDQEGVYSVNEVKLDSFIFKSSNGDENIDLVENALNNFNAEHGNELFDVIEDYIDIENPEPEGMEGLDEEIRLIDAIKQDSYPYGGGNDRMQTGKAYADQKPTNPNVRVKSPELDKYIQEDVDSNEYSMEKAYDDLMKKNGRLNPDYSPTFVEVKKEYEKMKSGNQPIKNKRTIPVGLEDLWEEEIPEKSIDPPISKMNGGFEEESEIDLEQLAQDKEEQGEVLQGGLGDNKSPLEFDADQIIKGLEVEKEHSDNSMVALEIVLDHLSEDPQYYSSKDNPEDSAQFNASTDVDNDHEEFDVEFNEKSNPKQDDEDMTDLLLGYKPKNVGDSLDEMAVNPKELEMSLKAEPYLSIINDITQKLTNDKGLVAKYDPKASANQIVINNYDWINSGIKRYNNTEISDMLLQKSLKDNTGLKPNTAGSTIMQDFYKKMSSHPEYLPIIIELKKRIGEKSGVGEETDKKTIDIFSKNYTLISRLLLNRMRPEAIVKHLLGIKGNIEEDVKLNEILKNIDLVNEAYGDSDNDTEKKYSNELQNEPYKTILELVTDMYALDLRYLNKGCGDPSRCAKNKVDNFITYIKTAAPDYAPHEIAQAVYGYNGDKILSNEGKIKPLKFQFDSNGSKIIGSQNVSFGNNVRMPERYNNILLAIQRLIKERLPNADKTHVETQARDIVYRDRTALDAYLANINSGNSSMTIDDLAFSTLYGYSPKHGD